MDLIQDQAGLLKRLAGPTSIPSNDPFWYELFSFAAPLSQIDPAEAEKALGPVVDELAGNDDSTRHVAKLIVHTAETVQAAQGSKQVGMPLNAVNATYLTRIVLKRIAEQAPLERVAYTMDDIEPEGNASGTTNVAGSLVSTLVEYASRAKISPDTYLLHVEVLNLLLVTCSTQLYSPNVVHDEDVHVFLEGLVECKGAAPALVQRLLNMFIQRPAPPARLPLWQPGAGAPPRPGVLSSVGRAASSVIFAPWNAIAYLAAPASEGGCPLADASLLLLLVLVNYPPPPRLGGGAASANPFRMALVELQDSYHVAGEGRVEGGGGGGGEGGFAKVNFAHLYDTLGRSLVDDRATLLLYALLHGNPHFREYVLVRADLDAVIMPLLEMLYNTGSRTPEQIYMLLIIILILSQDASFNAGVHKLQVAAVPWYKERLLTKVPLGSLMVLILIRTVKYNLSKLRDVFLHTNCLAALANMARHMHHLNAYASQRLVSLFDMLARKYNRLHLQAANGGAGFSEGGEGDGPTELHIYTDFLRIVLEIINAIVTYALPNNPEVVYALLHRQELFLPFLDHPRFKELLENILTVLKFFNSRMDEAAGVSWSVERVLEMISANARAWRGDGLKIFTELRFLYEEEEYPEEFFVPYVWTLVCSHSTAIRWDKARVLLFAPPSAPAPVVEEEEEEDGEGYEGDALAEEREISRDLMDNAKI